MTREEKKLDNAIKHLKKVYNAACEYDFVDKPLSYALYHTWKYYDFYETPKKRNTNK